ncbi:MAG: squalene/phytoene synthase family protein [bacterium]|nr:squalene/phytoene synthase family protein [bacterium]
MKQPHGPLTGPWGAAERIAAKDLNNLYLTSCFFADPERYRAFCALYAVMRVVDDRIDDIPSRQELGAADREREHSIVRAWHEALEHARNASRPTAEEIVRCANPEASELIHAVTRSMQHFPVPFRLWANFFAAMHQDLNSARFATYEDFLRYAEGASVAPTTIYLYLIVADRKTPADPYHVPPGFDLIACGRQLGIFAYLGHILRDLTQDLATGTEGLVYLAEAEMAAHGISEETLRIDMERGHASEPLKALVQTVVQRSWDACDQGRELLRPLDGQLPQDRAFILELIITIYRKLNEKLIDCDYDPIVGDHHLTLEEKQRIARETAQRVGYDVSI